MMRVQGLPSLFHKQAALLSAFFGQFRQYPCAFAQIALCTENLKVSWDRLAAFRNWDNVIDMDTRPIRHIPATHLTGISIALHYLMAQLWCHEPALFFRAPSV